jgi:phospholipid/cholesterol/gamma-HCH transport system substrate-binding protein
VKDPQRNYVVAGGFVLAMLIALVVVLRIISGRTGATDEYFATFDNVTGVLTGTKVLFEGYDIGQVEEIAPADAGDGKRFKLRLSVKQGWPIPRDSEARIIAPGVLAAFTVDLKAGKDTELLKPGSPIGGTTGGNLVDALSSMSYAINDLAEKDLRPLLQSISTKAPGILDNVNRLSEELLKASSSINEVLSTDNRAKVASMLQRLEATSDTAKQLAGELRVVLGKVDGMVTDNRGHIDQTMAALAYNLQVLANRIDGIVDNMDGMSRNLNEFTGQIRENPAVLLRGRARGGETADGR